jgi:NADH-quinone oxidoreductase subunit N
MYFDEPATEFAAVPVELNVVMAVTGLAIVTYFATLGVPVYNLAHSAALSLF